MRFSRRKQPYPTLRRNKADLEIHSLYIPGTMDKRKYAFGGMTATASTKMYPAREVVVEEEDEDVKDDVVMCDDPVIMMMGHQAPDVAVLSVVENGDHHTDDRYDNNSNVNKFHPPPPANHSSSSDGFLLRTQQGETTPIESSHCINQRPTPSNSTSSPPLSRFQQQQQHMKEEGRLIPEDRLTTWDLHREGERMSRTNAVKERLGPIVGRLKDSLAKIQTLEDSLQLGECDEDDDDDKEEEEKTSDSTPSIRNGDGTTSRPSVTLPGQSRRSMYRSMAMVKEKLSMLKNIEDQLASEEDRRHALQHHVLQVSLSQPQLALAALKRNNTDLQDRIEELEYQVERWEQKASLADDLQLRTMTMHSQLQDATQQNNRLEEDLQDRQIILELESDRCKELERRVAELTSMCDDLIKSLKEQEDRVASLEQELLDTRKYVRARERSHSVGPPRTIQSQGSQEESVESVSSCPRFISQAPLTITRGDSSKSNGSRTSVSNDSSSTSVEEEGVEGSSSSTQRGVAKTTVTRQGRGDVADDENQHSCCSSNSSTRSDEMTTGDEDDGSLHQTEVLLVDSAENPESIMIRTLMSKIEALDRENAELREGKQHALGKFKALHYEMKRQESTIQELQQKLNHQAFVVGTRHMDQVRKDAIGDKTTTKSSSDFGGQSLTSTDVMSSNEGPVVKGGFLKRFVSRAGREQSN